MSHNRVAWDKFDSAANEPLSSLDGDVEVILYFEPTYSGPVHLILGSFVMESSESVNDALLLAENYIEAARRCKKVMELVPFDCSYQSSGYQYSD